MQNNYNKLTQKFKITGTVCKYVILSFPLQ